MTEGVEIVHNVYNFDGVYSKKFPTFFKAFSSVNFLLTKFTACSQSCLVYSLVRVGRFSCLVHILVRVGMGRFSCPNYPRENFDKKGIFNYKGLDIKLLNIKLLNYIGPDFLYTARFGEI